MGRRRIHDVDLPTHMRFRRGVYFVVQPGRGKWLNVGRNRALALELYAGIMTLPTGDHMDGARILATSRRNAKTRGIEHHLTAADLQAMLLRSKGRCEVTGIPFAYDRGDAKKRPWSPSIDRIDSRLGYSADNCRLVCTAVNIAMNEWGEDVIARIARFYKRRNTRQTTSARDSHSQLVSVTD